MMENIDIELMHEFRRTERRLHRFGPRPDGRGPEPPHGFPFGGPRPDMRGPEPHGPRPLPREVILAILMDSGEEGMHQKEMADKLHIVPSSLSESIDKLEDSGYVTRETDPNDRRATLLKLTEKGKARAAEVKDEHEAHSREIFGTLSQEEKEQLLMLLQKMNASDEDEKRE